MGYKKFRILMQLQVLLKKPNAKEFKKLVNANPTVAIADILSESDTEEVASLLMVLDSQNRANIFADLPIRKQIDLLDTLNNDTIVDLFENLPSDVRVDIFNTLDIDKQKDLLGKVKKEDREDIIKLASYKEGSSGSVATSDYVSVKDNFTVKKAMQTIRETAGEKETIYVVYVVDEEDRLIGTVSLQDLVLSQPNQVLSEIMKKEPIFVIDDSPKTEASELIMHYDLLAVPVVNKLHQMVGIITVDDAMDIERLDDAGKITKFGGTVDPTGGNDLDFLESSFKQMFSVRVFWLIMLTIFGVITSTFVSRQEEMLEAVIILAAFIAPIVDMGGNTGSQSATLVIRAMALNQVSLKIKDIFFIIRKELPVALALGITVAILEVILAFFAKDSITFTVLTIVGLSMFICTFFGGLIGATLPFLARKIGTDPATLSSPMITSIMDFFGVIIYFGIAYIFLGEQIVATNEAKAALEAASQVAVGVLQDTIAVTREALNSMSGNSVEAIKEILDNNATKALEVVKEALE